MIAAVIFFVSSILSGYPETGLAPVGGMGVEALNPFMIYRFFGGIAIGMASLISPMYIGEIAPAKSRGMLVTFQQLAIVGGILLVAIVNLYISRMSGGNDTWIDNTGWRYMLASCALPAGLFFLAAFLMPDTPRWYVMKGHDEKALKLLTSLDGEAEATTTMAEIKDSLNQHSGKLFSFGFGVILIGIMLSVFQQFVGINAVLYYSNLMFKNANLGTDASFVETVIIMATNVLFTLVATFTVDRWGRKPLLILGAVIMAAAMLAMGYMFQSKTEGTTLLAAAMIYVAGFRPVVGPGRVGHAVGTVPELDQGSRHGHRGWGAVAVQLRRQLVLPGSRRQFAAERHVQPRLRLLPLRRLFDPGGAVRLEIRARNQGPDASK